MKHSIAFLDDKAKGLARDYLHTEGELLLVLMEMRRQKAFAVLNYTGVFDYCERALKLSRMQSFYFKSVADKAIEVPQIKAAITSGKLTLSQARRIVPVITKSNQSEWIEKASTLPQKVLEKAVTVANPKPHVQERLKPVTPTLSELRIAVDEQTQKNLQRLKDLLSQKTGQPATLAEVIAWAAEVCRDRHDPVRRAERMQKKTQATTVGTSTKVSFKAGNSPGRAPIPAAIRHAVMARDQGQCTHRGSDGNRCQSRRWIDFHHPHEVAKGGKHTVENLRLLCKAHHRLSHATGSGQQPLFR